MRKRQPRSDGLGIARPVSSDEVRTLDAIELTRYDLLLASIPLVLLVGWLLGLAADMPAWATLAAAAAAAVPLLADGLALNPPR